MKIAFMGASGSGKDYIAGYLISNHNYTRFSFSDQLKKLANYIYPWLDIDYPPESKAIPLNKKLSTGEIINATPREVWLHLNCLREIENKIFIRMLSKEIDKFSRSNSYCENVIITDIRSTEELFWCKENRFTIIHIEREDNNYEKYEIDKYILENKELSDYTFKNNYIGIDEFKSFFQRIINSES